MGDQINPKVVGACVVGFALVLGAYLVSNFGEPRIISQPAAVTNAGPAERVAIAVTDEDQNGIEDWRDVFVSTEITKSEVNQVTYTPPDTLTGQIGVQFMEGIINSRVYAPFADSEEQVVTKTVASLEKAAELKLYEVSEIDIMEEWDDEDIVNYANTLASILINNSVPGMDLETKILYEIFEDDSPERISELEIIRDVYQNYRDDSLKIPVPKVFTKAHLDLINTYHAIQGDVSGLAQALNDPAVAMIHLRRYPDDAEGLRLALNNMYGELEAYADLFEQEDPALLFILFSPDYQLSN
jgi:hypothetical protein